VSAVIDAAPLDELLMPSALEVLTRAAAALLRRARPCPVDRPGAAVEDFRPQPLTGGGGGAMTWLTLLLPGSPASVSDASGDGGGR
jgi:hypothetical protein